MERKKVMTIKIICDDSSRYNEYVEKIVNHCLSIKELPLKVILSLEEPLEDFPMKQEQIQLMNDIPCTKEESNIIEVDHLKIDIQGRRVWKNEEELTFTKKEFNVLALLVKNVDKALTKEDFYREVWGGLINTNCGNALLCVQIKKIREKIEKDYKNPKYVKTVRGVGYRFSTS